ncbi:bifunctional folylpolyglutamate synthase/dihydrofolate synthase [Pelagibacterium halotolerans]|uniref:tetrahydrofolate synthase n=1 Tax=Pelagibacterium halotolerans (strain DSM 22347 / JCM 15775 / CGMCC 1.7692 / B2) TaxID=1082931 RepID=G4R9E9_PELHB|nr:folylpolyglutamate synthase/dihydrofolate synthase family protein [Pelagibacterium halotolerans]AEQ53483.1 dihydrofolate synthase / folylpolyglutamate synthase [Pelagibacterium halotolerans B2]QJR20338.1 bifunctional folylpolyglutamate synthase/dihydrofolate synthase [Pelagibacterium halotolerans]SEA59186.1 dihydrofolate synthase / folylpolyglutamate synthase [Pelagibacterium halotolerans]
MSRTDAILKRLLTLHPKLIDLELGRTERMLEAIGRPQDRLPPVIHVAGTNGKGSTIAFLRAMLEAQGKRVHVYTSPHLVAFRERIRVAGKFVSARALNAALEECETANAGKPITFFEITTAAAFLLFSRVPADYLLLEVGLGGRFDSTNVIENPLGTIITPISSDHTQFLGETIGEIASAKAGIIKRGAPLVVARQPDDAMDVIDAEAKKFGVTPFAAGVDFDGFAQRGKLVYQDEDGLLDLPLPALAGAHQIDNAALALAAMRHFALVENEDALATGLRAVVWPARLMPLRGALSAYLAEGQELWLDGGHNAAGAGVLAAALKEMNKARPAPLVLVCGMMASKDAANFFSPLADMASHVFTVPIPGETGALPARALAGFPKALGLSTTIARSIPAALQRAAHFEGARIVICGSLYLAGAVLKQNRTPPV